MPPLAALAGPLDFDGRSPKRRHAQATGDAHEQPGLDHFSQLRAAPLDGGSNGYRSRAWKAGLQRLADDLRLAIHVSHFPPGTSKWNTIEHRLFCHVTQNWRGRPLRTFETVVALIGHTRTTTGLRVKARLDKRRHAIGVVVTRAEMRTLALHRHTFHGDWNYELLPRPS